MSALPAVRGLAEELAADGIDAVLVNIHDDVGAALTERFGFELSPTYLVFAASAGGDDPFGGGEVLRANLLPSRAAVVDAALSTGE